MGQVKSMRVSLLGGLCAQAQTWHRYQYYYLMGLRRTPSVRVRFADPVERVLAWGWERDWPPLARVAMCAWEYLASRPNGRRYQEATHVGRYLFHFPARAQPMRIVIDHYDDRCIRDPRAYEWADLYFKVNRWPEIEYGPKVRGLVAGNGHLDDARLKHLIGLRGNHKTQDLMLIAKLWPGVRGPTFWHPVEHLVRIFETVSKLKLRARLWAIVPKMIAHDIPQAYLDRLSRCGVPVTADNVTADELWTAMATSRLVFLRPGRHLCMSWRMIDHLAMGACTVWDRAPFPQWPAPLRNGRDFVDCACGIEQDESLPEKIDYGRIAETVTALLADPERAAAIRDSAAAYFDRHVAPEKVARYLLETIEQSPEFAPSSVHVAAPSGMAAPVRRPV